ncbi:MULTISPECIES: PEP/pyruvate-binding domain-containing protein [unclassified Streptomyces]|uniref:PEP/pyruvate-binding domain-containing protein n=1 Tax=unclassified Streptomyces TaxID=2593676 RepID=UPI000F6CF804|nr:MULTISPECIES: PEP/pyruvate-binding domain-containing protein [unclassified Streptomyces]AZM60907.1 phosphoenolpyruvate-utilizing enzyme [Streptomyces sp. WAC 01438]RSM94527.1 phosphoenolpyruvate-utilizing enzyme [Streptomyces sp. WAC 01420]
MTIHAPGTDSVTWSDHLVRLGSAPGADPAVLGGKAARLADLVAAGLPVPPAFCLTTTFFDAFLDATDLARELPGLDSRTARERVLATAMPAPMAEAVRAAYAALGRPRVAVRSSALKEDSATQSFAGQHDTVLDVAGEEDLLDAILRCWASLWSDRAAAYRQEGEPPGSIAVVVQEMVNTDVSGVLFTVDPVGARPHRIVVEACVGLGEGLVAGRVSSDYFIVDDRSLEVVEEQVRHKVTKCAPLAPGRIGVTKVEGTARTAPCLTHDQLAELARLALRVRDHYGCEQDIEWGLRDGAFHLFQTRPVTTRPAAEPTVPSPYVSPQPEHIEQGTLWSRMDIGEIFVGLMTPLGLSFAKYYQQHVHLDCTSALGVRTTGDPDLPMGYVQGHVYLNISYSAYAMQQALPTRDQRRFTDRFVSEDVDTTHYENPFGTFPSGIPDALSVAFWVRTTANEMARAVPRSKEMADSRLYEFDRARGLDLTRMPRRELHAELDRRLSYFHDMHVGYMPYYINAFGFYGVLAELCSRWLGEDGANLQNRVKTDMSNLRTVGCAKEIWAIAQAAKERPDVLRIIQEEPLDAVAGALRADEEGLAFWERHMEPFLRANGTRGPQEMELSHPRWVDDPSYLFQMTRRYAADGFSADDILQRGSSHHDDSRAALDRLPLPKRKALQGVISLYEGTSELRETTRMSMITSIWLVRAVVYEVGRRLVAAGVLKSLDEVMYLDFEDVRRYLAGGAAETEAFDRARIEAARRQHEYNKRLPEPPLTFIGHHDPATAVRPVPDGEILEGLGSSPGRVMGRARIVEDLVWQADEFEAGEILVTRFTDATWTPLFAIAGGVVTDIGSMLSHSSIVAREFNVPSVVNTKHATQVIRTGDLIVVDGDAGTVEVAESTGS